MKNIAKSIVVVVLTLEARVALLRHKPEIIAVTGNVGKTSTKDAIYAVVAHAMAAPAAGAAGAKTSGATSSVRKSKKSFNSEIGLPLTILGLETAWSSASGWAKNICQGFVAAFFGRNFPSRLILEIGADHPGDIEGVAKWLHPDIVVLTRMSDVPVHVEFFKGADDILREKMFLAHSLRRGGTLIINSDDPNFVKAVKDLNVRKIFYGKSDDAMAKIVDSGILYDGAALPLPTGQYARIKMMDKDIRIDLPGVIGDHLVYPVAAACAVAAVLGIQSSIGAAFKDFESPKGRMRVLRGINSSAVIDDTYNSSPLACVEALKTIAALSVRGRKIAVLGDMKELGDNAILAHEDIGKLAAETVHTLVTVGDLGKSIAKGARQAGMAEERVLSFDGAEQAAVGLSNMARAGDIILVKGSQSMRMERVSKALLIDPSKADDLLVRQEEEWKNR